MDPKQAKQALNRAKDELPKARMALKRAKSNLAYIKASPATSPALMAQTARLAGKAQAEYDKALGAYNDTVEAIKAAKANCAACQQAVAALAIVEEAEALAFIEAWIAKQPAPLTGVHRLIKLAWQVYRQSFDWGAGDD